MLRSISFFLFPEQRKGNMPREPKDTLPVRLSVVCRPLAWRKTLQSPRCFSARRFSSRAQFAFAKDLREQKKKVEEGG